MIRTRTLMTAGFALVAALASSGCGGNVDSPQGPVQVAKGSQVESASTERPSDSPPDDPLKLQEDALDALESGDLDAAFKLVRAAKAARPDDPQTVFLMARVLAERNRFGEAIKMLDEMAEAVPQARLPVLGQTAQWLVFQGQWQEAEKRYRTLLDQVLDASMVHRMLSQLLIRQGRRLEAVPYIHQLCRVGDIEELELRSLLMVFHPFPDEVVADELEPVGALGHARYEISQGNWDAALEELDHSTSKHPAEDALRGRIYAQLQNFELLGKWVSDTPESGKETADYWFAMGVYEAHEGDHRDAVKCFCEAVLRDQTDHQSYLLMSQSLEQLEADTESQAASNRAELIAQTQVIGNEMAGSVDRELTKMSTLIDLLEQLHRPLEALAWRAVQVYYGRSSSALSDQAAMQVMSEINRNRLQQLEADDPEATERFRLCGVDLDSFRGTDDGGQGRKPR